MVTDINKRSSLVSVTQTIANLVKVLNSIVLMILVKFQALKIWGRVMGVNIFLE